MQTLYPSLFFSAKRVLAIERSQENLSHLGFFIFEIKNKVLLKVSLCVGLCSNCLSGKGKKESSSSTRPGGANSGTT
jgi:hypothetical protein